MKIERVNVTNQVIDYLKENIEAGYWEVGKKIPSENQMTHNLGVSRASVRAAIQHMVGIGVLESVHGKGTFLVDNNIQDWDNTQNKITAEDCSDIRKVLEFRRIVEPEACYLAVLKVTPQLVQTLKKHLDQMIQYQGEQEKFVAADIKFHETICHASDNQLLEKSMNKVFEETKKNHQQINEIFGYRDGIYYHTEIVKAMEQADSILAKELMYEHLQQAMDRL